MGILKLKYKKIATSTVCGSSFPYNGNVIFPYIKKVLMSTGAGIFSVSVSTTGTPIRFKLYLKDSKVFTSPYIGKPSFQVELNAFNNDSGFPLETIEDFLSFSTTLSKTVEEQILKIELYCPLNNNSISINVSCAG